LDVCEKLHRIDRRSLVEQIIDLDEVLQAAKPRCRGSVLERQIRIIDAGYSIVVVTVGLSVVEAAGTDIAVRDIDRERALFIGDVGLASPFRQIKELGMTFVSRSPSEVEGTKRWPSTSTRVSTGPRPRKFKLFWPAFCDETVVLAGVFVASNIGISVTS
jgi:hypothetical protein